MATEARNVPRLNDVAARIHLTTVELTKEGDIFYLIADPGHVWERSRSRVTDEHMFLVLGGDAWRTVKHVGDGDLKQSVVVIHNTRNHLRGG